MYIVLVVAGDSAAYGNCKWWRKENSWIRMLMIAFYNAYGAVFILKRKKRRAKKYLLLGQNKFRFAIFRLLGSVLLIGYAIDLFNVFCHFFIGQG